MKGFKKLALVTAVAALPMSGFAMEALDDATLSDVTGQTGIQIGLSLTQTMDVLIDDTDGLDVGTGPATHTVSGGILIQNMGITGTATVEIDAGGESTVDGVLVVQVALANGFNIDTGDLYAVDTNDSLLRALLPFWTASTLLSLTVWIWKSSWATAQPTSWS